MKPIKYWEGYFDNKFAELDPWSYETSEYEQTKYARQIQVAENHLDQPDQILEIGCSEGVHSKMLLEAFPSAELLGISLSEREIERARERVDTERADFIAEDATEYLFNLSQNFDLVIWSESVYYMGDTVSIPEMYELVETVFDHITEGGLLVSANIVAQEGTSESRLTKQPLLLAYQSFFESRGVQVHSATYVESKKKLDSDFTYKIWGYRRPNR